MNRVLYCLVSNQIDKKNDLYCFSSGSYAALNFLKGSISKIFDVYVISPHNTQITLKYVTKL